MGVAAPAKLTTLDQWRTRFPVKRDLRTGRWGWREFHGRWHSAFATHRGQSQAAHERDAWFARWMRGEVRAEL